MACHGSCWATRLPYVPTSIRWYYCRRWRRLILWRVCGRDPGSSWFNVDSKSLRVCSRPRGPQGLRTHFWPGWTGAGVLPPFGHQCGATWHGGLQISRSSWLAEHSWRYNVLHARSMCIMKYHVHESYLSQRRWFNCSMLLKSARGPGCKPLILLYTAGLCNHAAHVAAIGTTQLTSCSSFST